MKYLVIAIALLLGIAQAQAHVVGGPTGPIYVTPWSTQ